MNRHLRALTFDNLSLDNHKQSLPFVQKILNANYSDRLKISSSQMLFRNMLDLDRGIFLKHPEWLMYKSVSGHMSKLLSMQDNLLMDFFSYQSESISPQQFCCRSFEQIVLHG